MRRILKAVIFFIGWVFSPFTWWNDIFINIPLSCLMANLLFYITHLSFKWLVIVSYWFTNVLGLFFMYVGGKGLILSSKNRIKTAIFLLIFLTIYSILMIYLDRQGKLFPIAYIYNMIVNMNPKIFSLIIFFLAYLLFILLPKRRTLIAISAGLLLVLIKAITLKEAFLSINWNVMGIFVGMLVLADIFMQSRVPAYIAEVIVNKAKNTAWAILFICLLTGFISAFVENVATVLIVAPIALSLSKKIKINPVKMMIAIAISSNLQGTATLIGDSPSMLLGGFAKMTFDDFFFYKGRPSIFFAVEIGAMVSFLVLYFIFRDYKEKVPVMVVEKIKSWVPTGILVILIFALAVSSFFDTGFSYLAGIICLIFGGISIIWEKIVNRSSIIEGIKTLDWETAFFLIGVFILVGSITSTGWIEVCSNLLAGLVNKNIFLAYTLIVVISVSLSAFIDNIPFLAAMLPVALSMSDKLQTNPYLFLFGLLIGASLGGNITPIGASANIVACGLLKKEGYEVKFRDFVKIGFPFTVSAVSAAYLFIWFVWSK